MRDPPIPRKLDHCDHVLRWLSHQPQRAGKTATQHMLWTLYAVKCGLFDANDLIDLGFE